MLALPSPNLRWGLLSQSFLFSSCVTWILLFHGVRYRERFTHPSYLQSSDVKQDAFLRIPTAPLLLALNSSKYLIRLYVSSTLTQANKNWEYLRVLRLFMDLVILEPESIRYPNGTPCKSPSCDTPNNNPLHPPYIYSPWNSVNEILSDFQASSVMNWACSMSLIYDLSSAPARLTWSAQWLTLEYNIIKYDVYTICRYL